MISRKISIVDREGYLHGAKMGSGEWREKFLTGWYTPSLLLILLLAAWLNFWHLGQDGYSNLYYAAGVRSMLINSHNFFFAAYDPNGFVSLDKPPVDFWLQVLSAKILGFSAFSLLFPQALAGVLSVALLAHLIRRSFGGLAGLMAALALTLTPISVITSRNNDVDSMLVLVTLLAAWAISVAVERGSLRWLLLGMSLVGIGFNIKMAEAYLVVPAFVLVYFLTAPRHWRTRIWHLALAGFILLVVSLSWGVAVDRMPVAQRPYVGSSKNNSELHLAFGYNGIHRLFTPPPRAIAPRRIPSGPPAKVASVPAPYPFRGGEDGLPGPMRLFNNQIAGQISWLLPLALIGMMLFLWYIVYHKIEEKHLKGFVLWGTWFITVGTFFSVSGFHAYYMVMLVPAICALVGIGVAALWHEYTNMSIYGLFLPLALLITGGMQVYFLSPFPAWRNSGLPVTILAITIIVVLFLFMLYFLRRVSRVALPALLAAVGMVTLLLAPTIWTVLPILENYNTGFPVAGPYGTTTPSLANVQMLTVPAPQSETSTSINLTTTDFMLLHFLAEHEGHASYLYATTTSNYSASVIVETGKGVMTMGGYAGADQILTRARLADLVRRGVVRYFLLPGTIPSLLRDLVGWIQSSCQPVPYSVWYPNKFFPLGTRIAGLRLYEYTGVKPVRLRPHRGYSGHSSHTHFIKR